LFASIAPRYRVPRDKLPPITRLELHSAGGTRLG
jgi:hypothetical protein